VTDYPLAGGISASATLGGYFERKGIIVTSSLAGGVSSTVVIGGVAPATVTFGGSIGWAQPFGGGITSAATLGGAVRPLWDPGITSTVTLGGDLVEAHKIGGGINPLFVSWDVANPHPIKASIYSAGGVTSIAALGGVYASWITGGVTTTASVGGSSYTRGLRPAVTLGGGITVTRLESISLDNDFYQTLQRQALPLIVYSINAFTLSQVSSLNNGDAFVVAPDFVGSAGDPFYDAGAQANYIGYYKRPGSDAEVVFRKPSDWETVYYGTDGKLYRYGVNRDTGLRSWALHRSMPQRALDGMQAFNAFDPDRVYDYVATIIGGYLAQLQSDARVARSVRNPDLVPRLYLPAALENIAATGGESFTIDVDASAEQSQRHMLSTAPTFNKYAGARLAVIGRLKALGFVGDVTTTWLKVGWPSILVSAPAIGTEYNLPTSASHIVVYGFTGGSSTRVAQALITIPPQRENANPGDWVSLTRYDSPNVIEKFVFIAEGEVLGRVNMGGGFKKVSTGAVVTSVNGFNPHETLAVCHPTPLESLESLRRSIEAHGYFVVESTTGIPGPTSVDVPWDYKDSNLLESPVAYWPSKYVTIHLNNLDGSRYMPASQDDRDRARSVISASLSSDVLPVHASISQWATDSEVAGSTIEVTESFSSVHV
jgi:hypothetical protein